MPIEPRSYVLHIRLTPDERDIVERAAQCRGLLPSEWARAALLVRSAKVIAGEARVAGQKGKP